MQLNNKLTNEMVNTLVEMFPHASQLDVSLREVTRWRIGGLAKIVISPRSLAELSALRRWVMEKNVPSVVIGGTSNLLFCDEGLDAVCINLASDFSYVERQKSVVLVGASTWVPCLSRRLMAAGLTGVEHICGIPGTLGGLIYMNGGSQRRGIGEAVDHVISVGESGEIIQRTSNECDFSYRKSIFQSKNEVIACAALRLEEGSSVDIRRTMLEIMKQRRIKFPQKKPNCGSVFISDPSMYDKVGPPGKVIELLGLKGKRCGGAYVSSMHANFIINDGSASHNDVIALIKYIRGQVFQETGYLLEVENRLVTKHGEIIRIDEGIDNGRI